MVDQPHANADPQICVVICTHNRSTLLQRTLEFLNAAERPEGCEVELLIVANACTDDTASVLGQYTETATERGRLPLRWVEEPRPGKSHALNTAIPLIAAPVVAFVDDDHRVDRSYLTAIDSAIRAYPEFTLFCGRIIPDWDGSEPAWAHDEGPYSVYPLPIPRYDHGEEPREIGVEGPTPGGGNLFLRSGVFERVGRFSIELGPKGHDLGGGEDSDFLLRALNTGERLGYVPEVIQYHIVDLLRLRLGYLMRKAFQRSLSITLIRHADSNGLPRYLWRKLLGYAAHACVSLYWPETRFYLVRSAATLGEINAYMRASRGR